MVTYSNLRCSTGPLVLNEILSEAIVVVPCRALLIPRAPTIADGTADLVATPETVSSDAEPSLGA